MVKRGVVVPDYEDILEGNNSNADIEEASKEREPLLNTKK
jgi:hypothetical protein